MTAREAWIGPAAPDRTSANDDALERPLAHSGPGNGSSVCPCGQLSKTAVTPEHARRVQGPEPRVLPTSPEPRECCEMRPLEAASGSRAGFAITIWRCPACRRIQSTIIRTDGQNFWVGAMGRAILKEEQRLIARLDEDPSEPPEHRRPLGSR